MSLDPELGPANTEESARPASTSVRYSAARHANHVDESPELLRWRADLLMDEMMLGGVDVSAADNAAPRPDQRDGSRYDSGYPQESFPRENYPPEYGMTDANGWVDRRVETRPDRRESLPPAAPAPASYPAPYSEPRESRSGPVAPVGNEARDETPPSNGRGDAPSASAFDRERFDRDGIDRAAPENHTNGEYRNGDAATRRPSPPVARREPTSYRQNQPEPPTDRSPARDPASRREPSNRPATPPVDDQTQWAHSPEKWDWQDFGATEPEPDDEIPAPFTEYRPQDRRVDSAVRQDSADYVNAMSVVSGKRRSTLLPRMSNLDPDALNREIAELHGEIATLLPVGHETSERARHLLDKAYSILQSDPLRSAEVEYYMQQVRTIVQRLRQTRTWSDVYRDRLRIYLAGWLAFSAVLLMSRYVFQPQLVAALAGLANLGSGSLVLQHWPALLGAAAAGALGGAIGALYTMRQHARTGDSFFDRKYGLRGLMLPIIGLIVGALGYLLFGGAYWLADVNPATNPFAGTLPALAAFAFGFGQESIYGTRG